MKFGQRLYLTQTPEWASHYCRYKLLKVLLKKAALRVPPPHAEPDLSGMLNRPSTKKLSNPHQTFTLALTAALK
jgi:SPX domain protein involved in polyphosphate accumulation